MGRTFTTTTWNCWAASRTEERSECTASEEEESQGERENRAGTVLCSHFDGVCRCVFGAGGLSALWQRVGGTAAPGAVCGADAGGRVSPGANQPGHTGCGHWGTTET